MRKIIFCLFAILLFFVPLVLWPFTSEVFEFNKMVLVYSLTALIVATWTVRCIVERKIIFSRTILDVPFLLFLGSQIISTVLSIDFYTSFFGYYSRFNGGLLSTICYLLLYWSFISNFDLKETIKLIKITLISGTLVCLYGVLEHFGIDKNLWVQDVQSRVFSTLGQPNWLAAWVVALIPITWALMLNTKKLNTKLLYLYLYSLFFVTLLFTKSRSGLAGFIVADVIFWLLYFIKNYKNDLKKFLIPAGICNLTFVILALVIGTQWTPSIGRYLNKNQGSQAKTVVKAGTALENGGTESGTIRKIVWRGAIQIWKTYPVFGTGLETYAYSYYRYRPIEHNVTSEWDFIYNKAHNEFLNMAANSGTVGLISYLVLIGFIIFTFLQKLSFQFSFFNFHSNPNLKINKIDNSLEIGNWNLIIIGLIAGYISLSVSNFFGFSVVPTQLEFFLFPAFAFALAKNEDGKVKNDRTLNSTQKTAITALLLFTFYFLLLISRYWRADILYAQAKAQNSNQRPDLAIPLLTKAINLQKGQAIYNAELAASYSTVAIAYDQAKDATTAAQFASLADQEVVKAVKLAPANVNIRRQMFGVYVRLSTFDDKYLITARDSLLETLKLAPTDPKLYYNLGIADANLGQTDTALKDFKKAVELKPNYTDARIQLAALRVHLKQIDEARDELNYILEKIDPGNTTAKTALDNLK